MVDADGDPDADAFADGNEVDDLVEEWAGSVSSCPPQGRDYE